MPHFGEWDWSHIRNILNSNGREWPPLGANIQRAIDDLPATGGFVWLPSLPMTIPAKITISTDSVTVTGPAFGTPTLTLANGVDDHMFEVAANMVSLTNMRLEGNFANNTAGDGIRWAGGYDLVLKDLFVMRFINDGLECRSFGGYIENCYFEFNREYGVHILNLYQNHFASCDFYANLLGNVLVQASDPAVNPQRNVFYMCRNENSAGGAGYLIEEMYAHAPFGNQIIGGYVKENQTHGIHLKGARATIIDGVEISDNSQAANNVSSGIFLEAGATLNCLYNIIKGITGKNDLANKQAYGVRENDAAQDWNLVVGHVVTGCVTGSVSLQGANSIAQSGHFL